MSEFKTQKGQVVHVFRHEMVECLNTREGFYCERLLNTQSRTDHHQSRSAGFVPQNAYYLKRCPILSFSKRAKNIFARN